MKESFLSLSYESEGQARGGTSRGWAWSERFPPPAVTLGFCQHISHSIGGQRGTPKNGVLGYPRSLGKGVLPTQRYPKGTRTGRFIRNAGSPSLNTAAGFLAQGCWVLIPAPEELGRLAGFLPHPGNCRAASSFSPSAHVTPSLRRMYGHVCDFESAVSVGKTEKSWGSDGEQQVSPVKAVGSSVWPVLLLPWIHVRRRIFTRRS